MSEKELPVEKVALFCPPLDEVAAVLQDGLRKNFAEVEVSVVDCPDLTQKPFMLAEKGLCGSARITDVGGVPYLMPLVQRDRVYDFGSIARLCELPRAFLLGAGAGPAHHLGTNSEMIPNLKLGATNNSHICKLSDKQPYYELKKLDFPQCNVLMNLFLSEGKPGKVLRVRAARRTGPKSLYTCMRHTLAARYGEQPVGLGGTFLLERGAAKIHVMPDFSKVPLNSDAEVDNWLQFFDMSAELISLGVLMSHDPGLDLRIEHFHCFSSHGDGGHYHYDVTPEEASYLGYFNIAEYMFRIDRPKVTHNIGRD